VSKIKVPAHTYSKYSSASCHEPSHHHENQDTAQLSVKPKDPSESSTTNDNVSSSAGQITLNTENTWNYAYTSKLHIGTPPQTIDCLFDTGSANAWILSRESIDAKSALVHDYYDPEVSSTAIVPAPEDMQNTTIHFGSGSLEGYFMDDICTLGDPNDKTNALVLENFDFGAVTE